MPDPSQIKISSKIWENLLTKPLPIIGHWGQRLAIIHFTKSVRRGSPQAVRALVRGLSTSKAQNFHAEISELLCSSLPASSHDTLWEEWSENRLAVLEDILLLIDKPASFRSSAWAISLAKLEKNHTLQAAQPEKVGDLLSLLLDSDPIVATSARMALSGLSRQASHDELYRVWANTRASDLWQLARRAGYIPQEPVELRTLYLLKSCETDELIHCTAEMVPSIIRALHDQDPEILAQARLCLPRLQHDSAINALCLEWEKTRSSILAEIIKEGQLVASRPIALRLMTALIAGRVPLVCQTTAEGIPPLFNITRDADPHLAQAALDALSKLENPSAQAGLCMLAVNENLPQAFEIALSAGYRPSRPDQLALFLFLTGLWSEYDELDFDNRLMQSIFETAQPELRKRIASQVQRSGKSAYLVILAGVDFRKNTTRLSTDEVRLLVEMLVENHEWPRLWSLVHLVPLPWSILILQTLSENNWQPETDNEIEEYVNLTHLSNGLPQPNRSEWEVSLPVAISTAYLQVHGRVNDVSFSPGRPDIAIGTGQRKLVVWDFHKAEITRIRQGFNHSIGKVAYVGSDFLVCGVRSNASAVCWIYGWQNEDAFVLPGHVGAVTSLIPNGETHLLSAGRDGIAIHWDLARRGEIARTELPDWPRTAFASQQHQQVVLMHSSLSILRLPDLTNIAPHSIRTAAYSGTRQSMARCGAFQPDGNDFLVGQLNGQVLHYQDKPGNRGLVREAILTQHASVMALAFMPSKPVLVAAMADGTIEFRHWPDLSLLGSVSTGSGRLTSLHISPDGSFMASGTDDASMHLWDLRIHDLLSLLERPLSTAMPSHLSVTSSLLHSSEISPKLKRTLQLIEALLQRRFRFDIQVEDFYQIQPGKFDILLE